MMSDEQKEIKREKKWNPTYLHISHFFSILFCEILFVTVLLFRDGLFILHNALHSQSKKITNNTE